MISILPGLDAVGAEQQIRGDLTHDHHARASLRHPLDGRSLRIRGMFENRMKGGDRWHLQGRQEVEDVSPVVTAEDPVFVLNRYQAHVAVIHELGGAHVVGLDPLPDLVFHLVGVFVLRSRIGQGQGDGRDALSGGGQRLGQVAREGGDATATRWIGSHQSDPQGRRHQAQTGFVLLGRALIVPGGRLRTSAGRGPIIARHGLLSSLPILVCLDGSDGWASLEPRGRGGRPTCAKPGL